MTMRMGIIIFSAFVGFYVIVRLILPARMNGFLKFALSLLVLAGAEKLLLFSFVYGTMGAFLPRPVQMAAGFLHAAVFILFLLTLARDAVLLALWTFRRKARRRTIFGRRERRSASGMGAVALTLAALLLAGYGMKEALRVPTVREVRLEVPGLPPALDGLRIAQLSDLHIGLAFDETWLAAVVARTDSLNPDLIVITGDVVDDSPARLAQDIAPLADLRAAQGVYLVPGNHEYYSGLQQWLPIFRQMGIKTLLNENMLLTVRGTPLALAGVTDKAASRWGLEMPDPEKAMAGIPEGVTRIMLAHRPALAPRSAAAGASLQLSGHTHGGLVLPMSPVVAAFNGGFVSGSYTAAGMPLYVSNGAGLWGGTPLRLFVPSEITLLTLRGGGLSAE